MELMQSGSTGSHRSWSPAMLIAVLSLLSACQTTPDTALPTTGSSVAEPKFYRYEVKTGDFLARIAQEQTGNSENWRLLADVNQLVDPALLSVGQSLNIPVSLMKNDTGTSNPLAVSTHNAVKQSPVIGKDDVVFQPSTMPGVGTSKVTLASVAVNREFDVEHTYGSSSARTRNNGAAQGSVSELQTQPVIHQQPAQSVIQVQRIRVTGSHYPKGIYAQPFSYSPLIMRVDPGTTLYLERTLGDWLQVRTEDGTGYIRQTDAVLVEVEQLDPGINS